MAAVAAAQKGAAVTLLERNPKLGRKLYITGKGRCNVTNDCAAPEVLQNVPRNSRFLTSAVTRFPPEAVKAFFEGLGVPLKTERGNRVFPCSDKAADIIDALLLALRRSGVHIVQDRARALRREGEILTGVEGERGFYPGGAVVIATGGRPMVKSAYSSGVPAYGSGAGNATVIIDNTCNTAERQAEAAMNTRISKCSDFGSGCSCDGNLIIHEDVYDGFVAALVKEGAYLANEEEAEKLKAVMWDEAGHRLPNTVAISPQKLAEAAGFEIPADRKFIAVTGGGIENVGKEHFFSSEKLTTLLTLFKYYGEFENALTMMQAMFNVGGKGHSCGIYSFDDDHIHRLGMCAPVSRIMVRQPNNRGNSGSSTNGMPPTSSMGCGTWGGNIVSENICLKHYMNTTWVARPLPEDMPSNEELFGEFNKPDMDVE